MNSTTPRPIDSIRPRRGLWRSLTSLLATGAVLALPHVVSAATATIIGLPTVPGGSYVVPKDVSDDGSTVVGYTTSTAAGDGLEAFRWKRGVGTVGLGDLPPSNPANDEFTSFAWRTSGDGSVVVGHSSVTNDAAVAFKWTQAGGLLPLGDLPGGIVFSQAKGVSDDGAVVVGYSASALGSEPFRWTAGTGMQPLGTLPGGFHSGIAWDISADGAVIVGQARNSNNITEAFRWTQATGLVGLGDLPGGTFNSRAFAISRNGQWAVGRSVSSNGNTAFIWSQATGMIGLGDLPGGVVEGVFDGNAYSVSDHGVAVGSSETVVGEDFGGAAFIWDVVHGMRNLKEVLESDYGVDMTGWTLESAEGISADGRFITGSGSDPDGNIVPWLVELPADIKPAGFVVTRIGLTNSAGDSANKINNQRQIIGTVDGTDGVSRGYIFSIAGGQETERGGYSGSDFTEWSSINSSGVLAGYYADPADPNFETFRTFIRDTNGVFTNVDWSGDPDFNFTVDINEEGQVAGGGGIRGWVRGTNGAHHAFTTPGYTVNTSWGMNDAGTVVGVAWPGFFDTPNGLIYHTSDNTFTVWNYPGAAQTTLYGINNRGDIVGEFKPNLVSANTPFVRWADGTVQVLSFPGLASVRVYDIDDDRTVVGRYKDAANKNRSFYATAIAPLPEPLAFTFTTFDIAGASESLISDIRNDGTLVGRFRDTNGLSHGYVQKGTNLLSFNVTGTTATYAGGMDNFGRVAGFYRDATNTEIQHGFIRQTNGTITTLDGPGQTYTYAWRINDAGQVNGYWFEDPFFIRSYRRAANGAFTTLVYSNSPLGTVTRGMNEAGTLAGWKWDDNYNLQGVIVTGTNFSTVFTVPGWPNTLPGDINNLGDIAGTVYDADFESATGFFRRADGATVTFRPPGAVEMEVLGLNDLGQVVGEYEDAQGRVHGFIARPAVALTEGHTDVGIAFEDGAFNLHIHDEEHGVEYAPSEAVLVALPATYATVPNDPRYAFLGLPCSGYWVLPQTQNTNLLFLGFGAEEIESGVFQGNQFRMELKAVSGAGDFFVYDIDPFGTPVVLFNTRDGVSASDAVILVAGAHHHANWAFTQPGYYTVTFEASGTLSNGTFVTSGPIAYTFNVEATNAAPAVLTHQHTDIGFAFEDGAWDLHVHNDTDDLEYAPGNAVLFVGSGAFTRVPDDARYAFLGAGCTPLWVLPQAQNTNLLFLGFGAEEIGDGVFQGNQFRVELKSFSGPGQAFIYDIDGFGSPVVFFNTANGVTTNDAITLVTGADHHANFAFTQPGIYRLSFEASGTLSNGTFTTSGPVDYTFCVEAGPIPITPPVLAITQTITNQVVLTWGGESGALYQLQSTAMFPAGWTNVGGPILGVCGTHQVSLPATNAVQFFQIITTSAP